MKSVLAASLRLKKYGSYLIGSQTSNNSTNKGTSGAERGDQFLFVGRSGTVVQIVFEIDQDGRNDTSVIAKERSGDRGGCCNKPDEPGGGDVVDGVLAHVVVVDLHVGAVWENHGQVGVVETLPDGVAAARGSHQGGMTAIERGARHAVGAETASGLSSLEVFMVSGFLIDLLFNAGMVSVRHCREGGSWWSKQPADMFEMEEAVVCWGGEMRGGIGTKTRGEHASYIDG